MVQYQLSQRLAKAKLLKEALVMDSASSVDLIGNWRYMTSIHKVSIPLDLNTTRGTAAICLRRVIWPPCESNLLHHQRGASHLTSIASSSNPAHPIVRPSYVNLTTSCLSRPPRLGTSIGWWEQMSRLFVLFNEFIGTKSQIDDNTIMRESNSKTKHHPNQHTVRTCIKKSPIKHNPIEEIPYSKSTKTKSHHQSIKKMSESDYSVTTTTTAGQLLSAIAIHTLLITIMLFIFLIIKFVECWHRIPILLKLIVVVGLQWGLRLLLLTVTIITNMKEL